MANSSYIKLISIFSLLFLAVLLSRAEASVPTLMTVPVLGLQNALAQANDLRELNQFSCDVLDQDGTKDYRFCRPSGGKYRCFADVRYENGRQIRIWGSGCYEKFSDCWYNGVGAVNPCR